MIYYRNEARNVQSKIEECVGGLLNFKLKPGDSVFHSFEVSEEDIPNPSKPKARRRRSEDDQLLTVSNNPSKLRKRRNSGLKLISDYLRNEDNIDSCVHSSSTKEKTSGMRRSSFSESDLGSARNILNPFLYSEYKDYLGLSRKYPFQSQNNKLLSSKGQTDSTNNPIIVVTNHI